MDLTRPRALLSTWIDAMEPWLTPVAGARLLGFGGDGWGLQAAWRHTAAIAVLADQGRPELRPQAVAAVRALCATHASGDQRLPDGGTWGRTWISSLALERAWHGVARLEPHLDKADRAALDRVVASEATWLGDDYERYGRKGIVSTRWAHEHGNEGESNLWNGCALWRAAERLPTHPRAAAWREAALRFLANGVCTRADLDDPRVVGPGFFDHYAFDHHGYLNVGYMVICLSNAGMLHLDARAQGFAVPDLLHRHQAELWQVVRRMIFGDGRLARIGGDGRVRYAYCQEYLVPAVLYAADHLGDPQALHLLEGWLALAEADARESRDGTLMGGRLAHLARTAPGYWLRLESDRACALSLLLAHPAPTAPAGDPEPRLTGSWSEPEHGDVLHRSPHRLAAFAWRAHGLAQGTCQPPGDGSLAEWSGNLVGHIELVDLKPAPERRRLLAHDQVARDEGFLTWGRLALGCGAMRDESWTVGPDGQAVHHLAFAALPDGRTVIGLEVVRAGPVAALAVGAASLHLRLANDIFNGSRRTVDTAQGTVDLLAGAEDGRRDLGSRWARLAPGLGVVGLTGGSTLSVGRHRARRGGAFHSLHIEDIQWGAWDGPRRVAPGDDLLDASWLVRCADDVEIVARANPSPALDLGPTGRAVRVVVDGTTWTLALNMGATPLALPLTGRPWAGTLVGGCLPGYGAALWKEG